MLLIINNDRARKRPLNSVINVYLLTMFYVLCNYIICVGYVIIVYVIT